MSKVKADIPVEYVRERLGYNPETGKLIWKLKLDRDTHSLRWNGRFAGKEAGTFSSGRINIHIDGRNYRGHVLAWVIYYGEWPQLEIDHKDNDASNNKITNLRLSTHSQNLGNRKVTRDGLKGVVFYKDKNGPKYLARIRYMGKLYYLGYHETEEKAHAAYVKKATDLFGEFARAA